MKATKLYRTASGLLFLCGRRQHVRSLDVLACCRLDQSCSFSSRSLRLFLRLGRTWL